MVYYSKRNSLMHSFLSYPKLHFVSSLWESLVIWCKLSKLLLLTGTCHFLCSLLCEILEHWAAKWRNLNRHDWHVNFRDMRVWQVFFHFRVLSCKCFQHSAAKCCKLKRHDWHIKFFIAEWDIAEGSCSFLRSLMCKLLEQWPAKRPNLKKKHDWHQCFEKDFWEVRVSIWIFWALLMGSCSCISERINQISDNGFKYPSVSVILTGKSECVMCFKRPFRLRVKTVLKILFFVNFAFCSV